MASIVSQIVVIFMNKKIKMTGQLIYLTLVRVTTHKTTSYKLNLPTENIHRVRMHVRVRLVWTDPKDIKHGMM